MVHSVVVCREGSVESIKVFKSYFDAETYSNNLISKILKSIDFTFPNYRKGEIFTLDDLKIGVYTSSLE